MANLLHEIDVLSFIFFYLGAFENVCSDLCGDGTIGEGVGDVVSPF